METEVGGPPRCQAQVLGLQGGCYTASPKPDAGKEVGSADLSLASSRVWPRRRGGLRFLWSFSWEAGEDSENLLWGFALHWRQFYEGWV